MRKIPTALVRDPDDRAHVLDEIAAGCEWVFAGEGVATRKYDGTCTMLDADKKWWARREVKEGREPPADYKPDNFDPATGKWQGWEPIEQSSFYKAFREAILVGSFSAGTYELCGPKINGNPEQYEDHRLIEHATAETVFVPTATPRLMMLAVARLAPWEGVVWHHPDGLMAKLKVRDIAANN